MNRLEELELIGAKLANDLLEWNWIHRRIEQIEFLDNRTFCRNVRIHLTLPSHGSTSRGTFVVPLTLMHKGAVTNLDFSDDAGVKRSLLTTDERGRFTFGVLRVAASYAAGPELLESRPELDDDLKAIAGFDVERADEALRGLLRRGENAPPGTLWAALYSDPFFTAVARSFALQGPVLLELEDRPVRQIISFSYNERVRRSQVALAERFRRALGWEPHRHWVPMPGLAHGGSYHLIVPAPAGIKATQHRVDFPEDGMRMMWREFDTLHLILKGAEEGRTAVAEVAWRPRLTFPLEAWMTAMVILLTLFVLGLNLGRLTKEGAQTSESAASLLLLIPALLAGYAAWERHPVERSLTLGIQASLLGSGFCCFVCAVMLAVGRADGLYGLTWWLTTGFAAVALLILSRTLWATILEDQTFRDWLKQRPQREYEGVSRAHVSSEP